jgi:hypothetical protein
VPERRNDSHRAPARATGAAAAVASIGLRLGAKAVRRPVDSLAILSAGALSLVIVVNAVFLQSRLHPAPFVPNQAAQPHAADNRSNASIAVPKSAQLLPAGSAAGPRTLQPLAARRNDLIAELIGSSVGSPSRVSAVQRVLSEFGYGQIKPSGILDQPTSAAIEKFEGEHKLPVTGRLSDRLLSEIAIITGRPID